MLSNQICGSPLFGPGPKGCRRLKLDWRDEHNWLGGIPLIFARLLGIAALVTAMFFASIAQAQRIILVCPPEADTSLTEAFNRLRGELSMHGFEVEIQTAAEAGSPENLALRAERVGAVASVSFVRSAGIATADITISDRVTGKTTIRTIATPVGMDAASLLALRAVELLRGSLREFGDNEKPPKDIVGATPDRASPTVTKWAESKSAPTVEIVPPKPVAPPPAAPPPKVNAAITAPRWSLRADVLGYALFPGPHSAYGAGGAVGFKWNPRIETRLAVEAPWFGLQYSTPHATSQIHLLTAAGELAFSIASARHVDLQLLGGVGLVHVTMYTTTIAPWQPLTPTAWLVMPRLGVGLAVALSPRLFWQNSAQLAALWPPTHLRIEDRRITLGLPMILYSTGVGARF